MAGWQKNHVENDGKLDTWSIPLCNKTTPVMDRVIADAFSHCLYCITCEATGRKYIGRSRDHHRRLGCHLSHLRLGKHSNKPLQADFEIHGPASLKLKILGWYLSSDDIALAESKAIRYFHDNGRAYNIVVASTEKVNAAQQRKARLSKEYHDIYYENVPHRRNGSVSCLLKLL